jgi:hypothetical protein
LDALAAEAVDDVDGEILGRLAVLYDAIDPVPPSLVDRISFGITLDALNAEIAELQRSTTLAGVRADEATTDTVTFTSETLTAMVTSSPTSAEFARVDGWITAADRWTVEVRTTSGTLRTDADVDGRFVFEGVARGLVQFTFRGAAAAQPVVTPALEI